MPDGVKIDMQWKQVKYIKNNQNIIFPIIPMYYKKDLIIVPDIKNWKQILDGFSYSDREEIIFLLERISWKRELRVIEMDIKPNINSTGVIYEGSIESTEGYKKLSEENLFDPNSILSKEQVKEIYIGLEKRFAENVSGNVEIFQNLLLEGSVLKEISIPILEKNEKVKLDIVN